MPPSDLKGRKVEAERLLFGVPDADDPRSRGAAAVIEVIVVHRGVNYCVLAPVDQVEAVCIAARGVVARKNRS